MKQKGQSIRPLGRNPVLTFRVRKPLYDAIIQCAKTSGRTIAAEATWRLELSFVNEALDQEMQRWPS